MSVEEVKEEKEDLVMIDIDNGFHVIYREAPFERKVEREIRRVPNAPRVDYEKLKALVDWMNMKYPEEHWYLEKVQWKGIELVVMRKVFQEGTRPWVDIYFDLQNQQVYVRKIDLERRFHLTAYYLARTLGTLRIAQSHHVRTIH